MPSDYVSPLKEGSRKEWRVRSQDWMSFLLLTYFSSADVKLDKEETKSNGMSSYDFDPYAFPWALLH